MSGPSYLWARFTEAQPDTPFSNHLARFIRNNHMRTLNFQVCVSGTFDDNTAGAWSIYPVANACLVVPWWYTLGFSVVGFLLGDLAIMFAIAIAHMAVGAIPRLINRVLRLARWVSGLFFI
ncbi:hypothetical protein N7G274_002232 [Stereocaulon virgatum]|uniref:Uncharacterized protein n=1 Tax=Stereocaulon virgatum TaxID=373712 RepID=A0ABR4AK37_9LECA